MDKILFIDQNNPEKQSIIKISTDRYVDIPRLEKELQRFS